MPQMVKFKCDILSDFLSEGAIKWIEILIFLHFPQIGVSPDFQSMAGIDQLRT